MDTVECLDFETPYGYLVSGSADKTLRVWDVSNHKCVAVLDGHTGWIRAVQLSAYTVVSGGGDHTAKLWDISKLSDSGQRIIDAEDDDEPLIRSFYGHTGGVTCLQFNHQFLLTGSVDKTIRQWDLETGVSLAVLRSEMSLESLDTNLDQAIYSELRERPISPIPTEPEFHAWTNPLQMRTPSQQSKIFNTGGHVGGIHFYQHALAAGYGDGVIRLFDLRSGDCHRALSGHYGTVTTVTFDDNVIISGSMDKTVKVLLFHLDLGFAYGRCHKVDSNAWKRDRFVF
jgi:division protein 1